jgi:hypothetical protein
MRNAILALLMAVTGALGAAAPETAQYVALDGTRLLSKPAAFSKSLATLKKGQIAWTTTAKGGYLQARVVLAQGTLKGWLSLRSVQKSKPRMTASAKKSGDASSEEVAAATKGFNKQVEAGLRAEGGKDRDYAALDKVLARTAFPDAEAKTGPFRQKGKLGEYQEGGR